MHDEQNKENRLEMVSSQVPGDLNLTSVGFCRPSVAFASLRLLALQELFTDVVLRGLPLLPGNFFSFSSHVRSSVSPAVSFLLAF